MLQVSCFHAVYNSNDSDVRHDLHQGGHLMMHHITRRGRVETYIIAAGWLCSAVLILMILLD